MTNNKLGRPPLSKTEKTVRLNASLTESQLAFLIEYGFNNASRGVQRLVDEKREEMDKTDA